DHRLNPSSSSSSIYSNALLRNTSSHHLNQRLSNLNLDPSSHPSGVPNDVLASPAPGQHGSSQQQHQPDPSTYGALYKFTGVFPTSTLPASPPATLSPPAMIPETTAPGGDGSSQSSFFSHTAIPLVRSFLQQGENCLLFAYGPTGSGKTWTVQGGNGEGEQGLLPRIVEVVWGSLKGKEKPLSPVTATAPTGGRRLTSQPVSQSTPVKPSLRGLGARETVSMGADAPGLVPVSDGYEYALHVSYSEIYNEKIYDLLDSPLPAPAPSSSSTTSTSTGGGGGMLKGLFRNFTTVKRSALSLKAEKTPATPGGSAAMGGERASVKVVGGLREVRVSSAEEAHRLIHQGQSNRRVFSTLANRASSRSHSIFTIKLVRTPLRSSTSSSSAREVVSKFSVVDLAGSERVVNTQTTGERLKEAGNINKSLMVLGQCMEVLRKNQERAEGRKPAIVPFRHSKLTEMFQSFFIGEGKAVMIVNINPYSTSYDENSHVMKFSAVARSVTTVQRAGNTLVLPSTAEEQETKVKKEKQTRVVRMSLIEGGEEEEVVYEEEDPEDDSDGEDEFVNALLDELSALRTALFESQMSTILAEANARQCVVREYEAKMLEMERTYQDKMREEAVEAENRLNAKLDILTRLQAAKTPARNAIIDRLASMTPSTVYDDSDEEEEDDEAEEEEEEEDGEEEEDEVEKMLLQRKMADVSLVESAISPSPLAARVKVHLSASHSPSSGPASPTTDRPKHLSASAAQIRSKAPSPLANEDSSHMEEDNDAPEADESVAQNQPGDTSLVQHGDEDEEEQTDIRRAIDEDRYDEELASEEDLSRLTEHIEEDGPEHSEEEADDDVVNLSQATDQLGDDDSEADRSRNSFIDDEAEDDEPEEEENSELDEEDDDDNGEEDGDDYAPKADEDDGVFEPSPQRKMATPSTSARQGRGAADDSFDTFSPTKTPAHAASPNKRAGGSTHEKENEPVSTPRQDGEDEDDADEFGLERSMVIRSGSKTKKTKRKLGVKKIHDADDLDSLAEGVLSPIRRSASKAVRQW
ncbi:hypothetical protein JCM11251_006466, partial [Rhodosporidiobolus azoricus]